jgi:hypothetical protein
MLPFPLGHGLPDLGAAIGAFIDEVDLRHAPVRLDIAHKHRKQSNATGAGNRGSLNLVMLDISRHGGSPSQRKLVNLNPATSLTAGGEVRHHLFRTDIERPHYLATCDIHVTMAIGGLFHGQAISAIGGGPTTEQ